MTGRLFEMMDGTLMMRLSQADVWARQPDIHSLHLRLASADD